MLNTKTCNNKFSFFKPSFMTADMIQCGIIVQEDTFKNDIYTSVADSVLKLFCCC